MPTRQTSADSFQSSQKLSTPHLQSTSLPTQPQNIHTMGVIRTLLNTAVLGGAGSAGAFAFVSQLLLLAISTTQCPPTLSTARASLRRPSHYPLPCTSLDANSFVIYADKFFYSGRAIRNSSPSLPTIPSSPPQPTRPITRTSTLRHRIFVSAKYL